MTVTNESDRLLLYRIQLLVAMQNWQAIEKITEKYLEDNAKDLSRPGVASYSSKINQDLREQLNNYDASTGAASSKQL